MSLKFERTEVVGWEHAIRGMRNPMNSWAKSDSELCHASVHFDECNERWETDGRSFEVGPNDLDLMTRLRNAGTDHRKFMRMITVYVDITGPLYWWKEFDTYKVGTVANSCSTMHKIAAKEFTLEDFSCEHLMDGGIYILNSTIDMLNKYRLDYLNPEAEKLGVKKNYWWQMIQLLPSSYNQKRTVMLNYEVLANIAKDGSRRHHKLDEWRVDFMNWIKTLPYSEIITGMTESEEAKEAYEEEMKKVIDLTERASEASRAMRDIMDKLNKDGYHADWTPPELEKLGIPYPATSEDIEKAMRIEHLVDVTCSWDAEDLNGERLYAIGPGFTREDLTPYELQLLEKSEAYRQRKKEE